MSGAWVYVAGVLTPFVLLVVVLAIAVANERGKEVECIACRYSTGPMRETRRIVCWARWQWHKLTSGHHTRRWIRQQEAAGRRLPRPTR